MRKAANDWQYKSKKQTAAEKIGHFLIASFFVCLLFIFMVEMARFMATQAG